MFGCNTFWLALLCSSVRIFTRPRRWLPSTRTPDSRQEPTGMYLPPSDKTTWGIRPSSHPVGSGTKRPGRRTAQSLPFIAEVEDAWRCTLIPPWTVMVAGCLLLFIFVTRTAGSRVLQHPKFDDAVTSYVRLVFTHHTVECVLGKSNIWFKEESLENTWLYECGL